MVLDTVPPCKPAQTTTPARFGASLCRDFTSQCGSIELAPGVSEPEARVTTSIITTAIGTESQFWAVKASLSVFHAPSQTVLTEQKAIFSLPSSEKSLSTLHSDTTWLTAVNPQGETLNQVISRLVDETAQKGRELSQIWNAMNYRVDSSTLSLQEALGSLQARLQCALTEAINPTT